MLDTWPELLIAAIGIITILAMVLGFLRRGGRVRAKGVEVAQVPVIAECAPYAEDHAAALRRLEDGQGRLEELMRQAVDRINQNDEATGALISSSRILTKWVRRELGRERADGRDEINGDLDEADEELDRAATTYRLGRRVG